MANHMTGAQRRDARYDKIWEQSRLLQEGLTYVVRRHSYQGVPQYGLSGCSETTPSRKTAEKWAALENAARKNKKAAT